MKMSQIRGGGGHCPSSPPPIFPFLSSSTLLFLPYFPFLIYPLLLPFPSPNMFQVTGVVFVSAAATVVTLDCVSPWENCDTWWLMFCLCLTATTAATLVVVVGMWCSSLLWAD
ncbi:unnamed protein product [Prunus armeniaca]